MNLRRSLTLVGCFLFAAGCSVASEEAQSSEAEVAQTSRIVKRVGGAKVEIERAALERSWVWRTALTTSNAALKAKSPANEFEDYQTVVPFTGRVVTFHDEGAGTWTLRERGTNATLATFHATEKTDAIVIDLDAGFRELIGDISVFEATASSLPRLAITSSNVAGDKLTQEGDTVFMRRVVDLAVPPALQARYGHVRLDHALAPYEPVDGFTPRANNEVKSFYVNPPVGGVSYAHRHDERKAIVFAMPSDTPKDRAADMETAARYWNGIFEKIGVPARVELKKLRANVDPFLTNEHTIEYRTICADGATGRGISQTDALTGRILKSNIHVSSVFTDAATQEYSVRWTRIQAEAGKELTAPPAALVDRAVSDYYVDTFAHEIGHTLGLRHNFAGNLASPIDGATWSRKLDAYVTADVDRDAAFTSSIMEYLPTGYATVLGAHIRKGREPFSYDVAAVRELYAGDTVSATERGPYCEKEQEPTHSDCQQNDMGPEVLSDFTLVESIADEATKLTLAAKAGDELITKLAIDPSAPKRELRALILSNVTTQLLSAFRADRRFVVAADAAKQQREALGRLRGGVGLAIRHIVETKSVSEADVQAVAGALRQKLETYLRSARVDVPTQKLDELIAAFESDFAAVVSEYVAQATFATP